MSTKRNLVAAALLVLASAAPALAAPSHFPGSADAMVATAPDSATLVPNPDAQDPEAFQQRGVSADEIPQTASVPTENSWEASHDQTPNQSLDACEDMKGRHHDYDCDGAN